MNNENESEWDKSIKTIIISSFDYLDSIDILEWLWNDSVVECFVSFLLSIVCEWMIIECFYVLFVWYFYLSNQLWSKWNKNDKLMK